MSSSELFIKEHDILNQALLAGQSEAMPGEYYRRHLLILSESYRRLVRESERMIARSDRAEREMSRLNAQLHQLANTLEYKASYDALTQVFNRGAIIERISLALQKGPASLIVLDIDHFKQVNDTYGHPKGDAVICGLIERLRCCLQGMGTIGRVGGEEFTVLLENMDIDQALIIATRLHADLNARVLAALPQQKVTVSFGISWAAPQSRFDDLYASADAALYQAKSQGRNCICTNPSRVV
ncbi:MAG: GGDEF domain-containing protein [Rouxiella aceris]|uniref:GGDEF domain-containing protein n=1 Tax=Rouxiella aceris TaxID=2703884 RepID=UPI0028418C39|nr:GGDEF domain-containing protein [Rouxiella aceris]MDR3434006.1 GGDEF domain-containing protein [Rouxiella aceris]